MDERLLWLGLTSVKMYGLNLEEYWLCCNYPPYSGILLHPEINLSNFFENRFFEFA